MTRNQGRALPSGHGRWRTAAVPWLMTMVAVTGLAGCGGLGSFFQSDLRDRMTDEDVALTMETLQVSLESDQSGDSRSWSNPDTGMTGRITPHRAQVTSEGRICRPFTETIRRDDREATVEGRACRLQGGTWQIESPDR